MNRKYTPPPQSDRSRLKNLQSRLRQRAEMLTAIRAEFVGRGFLEVETPTRIPCPAPEIHIDAQPSGSRYLITSPELQMKRLLAAGYDKIFQICHCFRQGERSEEHLPEFTMLEWYRLEPEIDRLLEDCQWLITGAARALGTYPLVTRQGIAVDLSPPWHRLTVSEAFERFAGWRPGAHPDPDRFDVDLVEKVEPSLPRDKPVFLEGYPASMASLARLDPAAPQTALRFELYIGGLELANGFAELTDAAEQEERFEAERAAREKAGKSTYPLDRHFLFALQEGLAPCVGIALGLDRLAMVLTGAASVDEIVAFPEGTA